LRDWEFIVANWPSSILELDEVEVEFELADGW